jgi:hypothetical protein
MRDCKLGQVGHDTGQCPIHRLIAGREGFALPPYDNGLDSLNTPPDIFGRRVL